jgi:hypothetical protein
VTLEFRKMKGYYFKTGKKARRDAETRMIRAVASSTAIETGEAVGVIEKRLKSSRSRFKNLKLA